MKKCVCAALLCLILVSASAASASQYPEVGDILPEFTMAPLALEEDAVALGLDSNREFTLADISTPYIYIEILGVYCTVCQQQQPTLTKLYKWLKKTKLNKQITMLGIAAGGTTMEVEYIRKKDYLFPVVHDTEFEIYDKIGDTKTPFTLIVDRQGKVLFAHQGIIEDYKAHLKEIQALVK
ncbi:MAG: TlpA family protein disulfide reductase [Pseudodesulfovibrio sp.]